MRQTIYLTQHSLWQNQAAGQRLEQASGGDSAAPRSEERRVGKECAI